MTAAPDVRPTGPSMPAGGRAASALLLVFALDAAVNLVAQVAPWPWAARVSVWLAVPLLIAWAWTATSPPRPRPVRLLLVGAVFGWGGDVALSLEGDLAFLLGMVSFLVMQVLYISAYRAVPGPGLVRAWPIAAVPYALVWLVMNWVIRDGVGDLRVPVLVYSAALLLMAVAALDLVLRVPRREGWLVAWGAVLFVISDGLIALREFGDLLPGGGATSVAIMATYLAAQALIVTGFVRGVVPLSHPSRSAATPTRPPTPSPRPRTG